VIRAQQTLDELEAIQADRPLTNEESEQLERILRRLGPKRDIWRWSAKDDRKLKMLIKRRGFCLRIKPFQRNDEVQRIAEDMGRSYEAVLKRIQRLRSKMSKGTE
jgi:uncharacterized coiled-coil DUF342 family protein